MVIGFFDSVDNHFNSDHAIDRLRRMPFIVVDEEAARCEVLQVRVVLHILFMQGKVERGRQSIRRAAAQMS